MKTMTCKQLGGACDKKFSAETFEQMAQLSQQHGMEMFQQQDSLHLAAMAEIQGLMKDPDAMTQWMDSKRKQFEALPDNQ